MKCLPECKGSGFLAVAESSLFLLGTHLCRSEVTEEGAERLPSGSMHLVGMCGSTVAMVISLCLPTYPAEANHLFLFL